MIRPRLRLPVLTSEGMLVGAGMVEGMLDRTRPFSLLRSLFTRAKCTSSAGLSPDLDHTAPPPPDLVGAQPEISPNPPDLVGAQPEHEAPPPPDVVGAQPEAQAQHLEYEAPPPPDVVGAQPGAQPIPGPRLRTGGPQKPQREQAAAGLTRRRLLRRWWLSGVRLSPRLSSGLSPVALGCGQLGTTFHRKWLSPGRKWLWS